MDVRSRGVALAAALGMVVLVPGVSHAETGDAALAALAAANTATITAARSGIDVVQQVTFSRGTELGDFTPRMYASVPGGTRLRVHATASADGSGYTSVRFQPSGRLLAAGGIDPASMAPWATLRLVFPDVRSDARRAGLNDRTALTGVSPEDVLDSAIVSEPARLAADLVLPPYAGSGDEGWTTIETIPQADGTTVIRGSIRAGVPASDGEDRCTRPLVELTVGPDNVARSSRWTETCPGAGTRTYRAVAVYGPQTPQPPTRPRADASVL